MKFPKLLTYLAAFSLITFSACNNDDNDDPTPVLTNCKPIKVVDEDGTSLITYTQDRISALKNGDLGNVTVEYNSAGKASKLNFTAGMQGAGSLQYVFDNQGRMGAALFTTAALSEIYDGGGMFTEFEYNNAGKIVKATRYILFPGEDSNDEPTFYPMGYTTFEYNTKGNVTIAKDFADDSETPEYTTEFTYDDKNNPSTEVENLFIGIPGLTPGSPNNQLTVLKKEGSTVVKDESYTNVYEYNSGGYPTKITRTPQQGSVSVSNIEYSCK